MFLCCCQFCQKPNQKVWFNNDTSGQIVFVYLLEEFRTLKRHLEIKWPLLQFWVKKILVHVLKCQKLFKTWRNKLSKTKNCHEKFNSTYCVQGGMEGGGGISECLRFVMRGFSRTFLWAVCHSWEIIVQFKL